MLRSLLSLGGYSLGAVGGEIGKVRDFYFDDSEWVVRYLVADTGKWLPGRLVLIAPSALGRPEWEAGVLPVSLTKEQVEKSPSIDADKPVSRQRETEVVKYYGWPAYWNPPMIPAGPLSPPASAFQPAEAKVAQEERPETSADRPCDLHLRSALEVIGYRIEATDGRIGHVEDFIMNDDGWAIQYVVIDTKNWWPSRKVLMLPMYVVGINWDMSVVRINAPRESVASGPTYDPSAPINREHEIAVYDYYGRPRGRQTAKEGVCGIAVAVMASTPTQERDAQ